MKQLFSLILLVCLSSCRTAHQSRQGSVVTTSSDTAHFAHIFSATTDSTATLTWLAIDTLDVWLTPPDSSAVSVNATPHTAQLRARNLRLVRAETSSTQTRQDSVRSQSQSFQSTTSQVSDKQQAKPSNSLSTILNLIALAVLAIALYFFHRYIKHSN